MQYLDLTYPSPEENLACDEALLQICEDGLNEDIIRFWEPHQHFVVLGLSGKIRSEVYPEPCKQKRIPILRRASGGGTVLQGPGCLNYSLILRILPSSPFASIRDTYATVMTSHREAIEALLETPVDIQGISDLALEGLKFSGNSQRRKRRSILFHGTFLLSLDLSIIEEILPLPERQPDYRRNRTHSDFLTNIRQPAARIKEILKKKWGAHKTFRDIPDNHIRNLVQEKYSAEEWNFKF